MRYFIVILITIILVGCSSYDYKITSLKHKNLNYTELPFEVRKYLSDQPKCEDYDMLLFVDLSDTANYSVESIKTFTGPWIKYEKLVDKQKNISYRISQDVPSPFIVFQSKLYIPDKYNILCGGSIIEAIYTEYQLK